MKPPPMSNSDLAAYLTRIGYSGTVQPSLTVLRAIHVAHLASITYENIDVLLKQSIRLDRASLHAKMITGGRGGYCFEQNTYFQWALAALGFTVRAVAARVFWRAHSGEAPPRNHMVLIVTLSDGDFLADVGFGLLRISAPLRLEPLIEQHTSIGVYRLLPVATEYQVQIRRKDQWSGRYQLSLHEQTQSDWDVANYYLSTHPDSPFTTNLMAARTRDDARLCLHNNRLRVHHPDGTTEVRILDTPEKLEQVLTIDFDIALPDNCGPLLARIALQA